MKTYGDAAALLHTFLSASPDPDSIGTGTGPRDKLLLALKTNTGTFDPGKGANWRNAAIFDKANLGTFWYQKTQQPPPESSQPDWTLDDSLSTASMLAFAIPEVGAILSAGIGAFQHFVDNTTKVQEAIQARTSLAATITDELERFMSKQAVNQELRDVISRATILKSHMRDMLADPSRVTSAPGGFKSEWVATSREKPWVLGPEFLGAVWTIVESDAFLNLMTESDAMPYQDGPALNLVEAPSLSMCTIDAYTQITGVVVNALILYSLVALMPARALKPGWDPKSFDLMAAVRSPAWHARPNPNPGKSAYDCWMTLQTYLDSAKTPSWITRVDPDKGDARKAFDKIKARLDRISFGFGLPKQRDGYWFLREDASTGFPLHVGERSHPNNVFMSKCVDGQSEVKDTTLSTKQDTFADPYRNFKTTLGISWSVQGGVGDVFAGIFTGGATTTGTAIAVAQLNKEDGRFWSPWNEKTGDGGAPGGTYDQLCWRASLAERYFPAKVNDQNVDSAPPLLQDATALIAPPIKPAPDATWASGWLPPIGFMDDPTGRDTVGWMGYVLSQYIADFNYKLDVAANVSTFSVTRLFYDAWTGVHQYAGVLLGAGAAVPSGPPAKGRPTRPGKGGAAKGKPAKGKPRPKSKSRPAKPKPRPKKAKKK